MNGDTNHISQKNLETSNLRPDLKLNNTTKNQPGKIESSITLSNPKTNELSKQKLEEFQNSLLELQSNHYPSLSELKCEVKINGENHLNHNQEKTHEIVVPILTKQEEVNLNTLQSKESEILLKQKIESALPNNIPKKIKEMNEEELIQALENPNLTDEKIAKIEERLNQILGQVQGENNLLIKENDNLDNTKTESLQVNISSEKIKLANFEDMQQSVNFLNSIAGNKNLTGQETLLKDQHLATLLQDATLVKDNHGKTIGAFKNETNTLLIQHNQAKNYNVGDEFIDEIGNRRTIENIITLSDEVVTLVHNAINLFLQNQEIKEKPKEGERNPQTVKEKPTQTQAATHQQNPTFEGHREIIMPEMAEMGKSMAEINSQS